MALTIGDTAPDFEADTTEGRIRFHDWLGDCWGVLFSHPRDFTPVCTTELGYMAAIKPEFDRRGVKIIGLSIDPLENHEQVGPGHRGDAGHGAELSDHRRLRLLGRQGLRDAARRRQRRSHAADGRPEPDRPQRVRDRTGQEDQAHPDLSDDDRSQLRRGPARDRLAPADGQAQGRNPGELEAGRERDHRGIGLGRRGERDLPGRLGVAPPLHPDRSLSRLDPRAVLPRLPRARVIPGR